jgi:hypothetical protein
MPLNIKLEVSEAPDGSTQYRARLHADQALAEYAFEQLEYLHRKLHLGHESYSRQVPWTELTVELPRNEQGQIVDGPGANRVIGGFSLRVFDRLGIYYPTPEAWEESLTSEDLQEEPENE